MWKTALIVLVVFFLQAGCAKKTVENDSRETGDGFLVEVSFDSAMCYVKDTSISPGKVFIYASSKNLTGDSLSLRVSDRGFFSTKNRNMVARFGDIIVPIEICAEDGLLILLPNENTSTYYYKVNFGTFSIIHEQENKEYFIFSKRFYDAFFEDCEFYMEDSTTQMQIRLLKNPEFKVLYREDLKYLDDNICSPL